MVRHVSAEDARARFQEMADRVRATGEPVVVEQQGEPIVALISMEDLDVLDRARANQRQAEFSRLVARAAAEQLGPEPTEEEIVQAVKETREALFQ